MSTFLTAQSLTLSHTTFPLFKDLNFTISQGDKIGIVGHNGCGKSSLLKLLSNQYEPTEGHIAIANHCLISYVEQHIPASLKTKTLLEALQERFTDCDSWQAELLLAELGFVEPDWCMPVVNCSGGQQMRLLLARAIINQPDLLLLDEPSNHLDLPSLLWLEQFLSSWKSSYIIVSHDQRLLDSATNTTWFMRDQTLLQFSLPFCQAKEELLKKDEQDLLRHATEQKEIDRLEKSAKRLANWGKVYDNENLARKAKTMFARKKRLEIEQTELGEGSPWRLKLHGEALAANRLMEAKPFSVRPSLEASPLFDISEFYIKSGDRVAILGSNGCGKSTLLNVLYQNYLNQGKNTSPAKSSIKFHERVQLGYYDQSLNQLNDSDTLIRSVRNFSKLPEEQCKHAMISAGFKYSQHDEKVMSLSGGERARLLFVALTLANYHMLFLDEPTNHLDMNGKDELIETLNNFKGAALLVSHDRNLIENCCNRFWLIHNDVLTEYLSFDDAYRRICNGALLNSVNEVPSNQKTEDTGKRVFTNEEGLLKRLIELEGLLEDDLQRKPKHQKPNLQQMWCNEINSIKSELLI